MKRETAVFVLIMLAAAAAADDELHGWTASDRAYDTERIAELDAAIADGRFRDINGVVVIYDRELLVERYYNGADRERTHNTRSVGKTFAAAVLGIAIREGHVGSVDDTLGDFYDLRRYAHFSDGKRAVTLEQLITMTSGFDGFDFDPSSPGNEENMYPQDDWVRWTLDLPMAEERNPGDEWRYFTAGIVVLGDILNRAVPGGLEAYAHDRLFGPLGITNYEWQHTPQRVANTAGGIQLTPLDYAKFGQLFKDGGRWRGEVVIPAEWARESLEPKVETVVDGNAYGYLWWHRRYRVGATDYPVSYCSGNGGNKIFVFETLPLVVVVTASAYGRRYMHTQVDEMMERYVLPAVVDAD